MDVNSSFSFANSFQSQETANFSNKDIRLLSDIPLDNFSSLLPTYKYLNLSNNSITAMDGDFIKKFSNINYLNISGNKITKIQGIESLNNLKYLDISNNEVALIESIENCSETLEKIVASHNNIHSIFFISAMNKLEFIDVRENQINNISFGKFVPHLHTLKIDNNFLNDISSLSEFEELEFFSASSNQITKIPKLAKFTLRTINLSNNKITSLLSLNQTKLVTLDVSDNPISDDGISNQITVNKNLRNLFISSAKITRCHCLSKIFPCLSTVDLSKTQLKDLQDLLSFVHEMKNLKVLDIRFTPLTRDLYPGIDLLTSAKSVLNQNDSFQQQKNKIELDAEQEKHYDSILLYNQRFPDNSEKRTRFRSEVIKASVSQLQILDHIKVSQSEYSAIESQPIKLTVNDNIFEEEEEIVDDYNMEENTEINEEEEETFSEMKDEIQYRIEITPQNQITNSILSENKNSQITDFNDVVENQSDDESEKISINIADSESENSNIIEKLEFFKKEIETTSSSSNKEIIDSFDEQSRLSEKNSKFSKKNRNSPTKNINSFKIFTDLNKKEIENENMHQNSPFHSNPHLYNFLTHISNDDDNDDDDDDLQNENETDLEKDNIEEESEEDDVMITTQIIAQTLNGGNKKADIKKNIEYINRSVQAEIDSIFNERKKREHDEKMKKIKRLRKENKILEKEIKKFKMKKKEKRETETEVFDEIKIKQKSNKSESKSRKNEQSNLLTKTQISNSSNSHHNHHHNHSNSLSKITIQKSSKSHHHHHSNKTQKVPQNLQDSDHLSISNKKEKVPFQSSSSSLHLSDSDSKSTSNSYVIKTKKKSISIEENEIVPENISQNEFGSNKEQKNDSEEKKKTVERPNNSPSFKYPQIIELLDGLLAENQKLGGKIAASINQPYNSTPVSPNQGISSKKSKKQELNAISSSSYQKVSTEESKSSSQTVNPQIRKKKSKSILILSSEISQMNLPQITREYAEQKIIQMLKSIKNYSPLTENSEEMKFLLLWLIQGLPFSVNNIRNNMKDISMKRDLNLTDFNCNLTVKAADKNRHYYTFFESRKTIKNLQLLMLFNFNYEKSEYDCYSSFSQSNLNLNLNLMFNFDVDEIPQDAEFFRNLNHLFKGMPPFLSITVCVADLGKIKMLKDVKECPSKSQQEKIASKGYDSICFEKSGLKHYILFDKARSVPVYTLLFSTI